jgi:TatD DNase family protein
MNYIPYINLYAHSKGNESDIVSVTAIFPGDPIPAFTGRNFYCTGLSPDSLKDKDKNNELLLMTEDALEFDHIIFVGSCGLNKNAATGIYEQLRVFEAQAIMAEEYQKPLLLRCTGSHREIIEIYNRVCPAQPWILHDYNLNAEATSQFLERNFRFSFGNDLLDAGRDLWQIFSEMPEEKIFLETNELNGDISRVYKKGAEIKNIPEEDIKLLVWNNFNRLENVSFNDLA